MKNAEAPSSYPPYLFVRAMEKWRRFLLRFSQRFTHPKVLMWERVQDFWLAAGIGVVAELGIADLLANGPASMGELAAKTSTHEASLYRLMRMLASHGIFREKGQGFFESTRLSRPLEDGEIRHLVKMHLDPFHLQMFSELKEVVKSGKPLHGKEHGKELFELIAGDKDRIDTFNLAMSDASRMQIPTLLSAFPFGKYAHIIDLGGGQGLFLAAVLEANPRCRGSLFDLEQGLLGSEDVMARPGLEGRMEALAGDFFKKVPSGGDLYMMKSVLHDWKDEEAQAILEQVHEAMDGEARLLVIETVLDQGNAPSAGKMTDLLMMVSGGGRERTRSEFTRLLEQAGFHIRKIHPTISPHSIIEARRI